MGTGRKPTSRRSTAVATAWALALGVVVGNPAEASAAQTLSSGQVVTLSTPGVSEMHPGDGRLGGYGFMADVTGVAFAATAGAGDEVVAAAPGDQLVVVSLAEYDQDQSLFYAYDSEASPTYYLVAGRERVPLPSPGGLVSPSTVTWAVAVPTGSPAELVASRAGFSQRFDLRLGRRVGVSPAALYRGGDAPELDVAISVTQTLNATGGPGGHVSLPLAPTQAALAYFKPGASLSPAPPVGRGWLIIDSGAPIISGPPGTRSSSRATSEAPISSSRLRPVLPSPWC